VTVWWFLEVYRLEDEEDVEPPTDCSQLLPLELANKWMERDNNVLTLMAENFPEDEDLVKLATESPMGAVWLFRHSKRQIMSS
jgi:hypothetical protein